MTPAQVMALGRAAKGGSKQKMTTADWLEKERRFVERNSPEGRLKEAESAFLRWERENG